MTTGLTKNVLLKYISASQRTARVFNLPYAVIDIQDFQKKLDIAHFGLGLSGEFLEEILGEKDKTKIDYKEEYGDIMWYLAGYIRTRNINFDTYYDPKLYTVKLEKSIGWLTEAAKKWFAYDNDYVIDPIEEEFHVFNVINILAANSVIKGFTLDEVLLANLAKLRKRYPEKFSGKDAVERKDKKDEN